MNLKRYRKLLPPIAGVLAAVGEAIGDGELDATEVQTIAGAIAIALCVWALPNAAAPEVESDDGPAYVVPTRELTVQEVAALERLWFEAHGRIKRGT